MNRELLYSCCSLLGVLCDLLSELCRYVPDHRFFLFSWEEGGEYIKEIPNYLIEAVANRTKIPPRTETRYIPEISPFPRQNGLIA